MTIKRKSIKIQFIKDIDEKVLPEIRLKWNYIKINDIKEIKKYHIKYKKIKILKYIRKNIILIKHMNK